MHFVSGFIFSQNPAHKPENILQLKRYSLFQNLLTYIQNNCYKTNV